MRLERDSCDARYQIKAYEPGSVTINDKIYHHSLIVTGNTVIHDWGVSQLDDLNQTHLQTIIALKPEIIILGAGLQFQRPNDNTLQQLKDSSIGFEYMDTGAACRTFMALLTEGRHVAAGLII